MRSELSLEATICPDTWQLRRWLCGVPVSLPQEDKHTSCRREEHVLEHAVFLSKPEHRCVPTATRWLVVRNRGTGVGGEMDSSVYAELLISALKKTVTFIMKHQKKLKTHFKIAISIKYHFSVTGMEPWIGHINTK